jgi:hypothetical protein
MRNGEAVTVDHNVPPDGLTASVSGKSGIWRENAKRPKKPVV